MYMHEFFVPTGDKRIAELEGIQSRINQAKTKVQELTFVPLTEEEHLARLTQAIAGAVDREDFHRQIGSFRRRMPDKPDRFDMGSHPVLPKGDSIGWFVALAGGAEKLAKSTLATFNATGKAGMATPARNKRLAELREELLKLETEEEQLICRLEKRGHAIQRRPDVDVQLLRKLWNEMRPNERARTGVPNVPVSSKKPHINDSNSSVSGPEIK